MDSQLLELSPTDQFFHDYHFDGCEKIYMKHRFTQEDINNGGVKFIRTNNDAIDAGFGFSVSFNGLLFVNFIK